MNLKLLVIKTPSKIYITDNIENRTYFNSQLNHLLFDGEKVESTYLEQYKSINRMPTKITKVVVGESKTLHYKLKEGYTPSKLLPETITSDEYWNNESIQGLYTSVKEKQPDTVEDVPFEIEIIQEAEFDLPTKEVHGVSYPVLTKITTPKILLPFAPCELKGQALFKMIAEYIKTHVTCKGIRFDDYDWKFEVKKEIELSEPYSFTENVNLLTKKKPKYVTHTRTKEVKAVFKITYEKDVCSFPTISADNINDLQKKFTEIMEDIMKDINEEVVYCPCCKGHGVILKSQQGEK